MVKKCWETSRKKQS